jgi:hypothetical protein
LRENPEGTFAGQSMDGKISAIESEYCVDFLALGKVNERRIGKLPAWQRSRHQFSFARECQQRFS